MNNENNNSNLTKRVIVGIIAIPLLLLLIYAGGKYFTGFLLLVEIICLYEFLNMFGNKNFYPLKIFTIIFSVIIYFAIFSNLIAPIPTITIFFVFIFTIEIFRTDKLNPLNPFLSFAGIFYVTVPAILLALIRSNGEQEAGFYRILMIFILIWLCDTFAYFGGKLFGKNKLTDISPGKTVEGSVTGFLFAVISGIVMHFIFQNHISFKDGLIVGLIIGIFGQTGDLLESSLKRFCDIKDSSNIIPGHGGMLDRFDSLLFVSPLIYIYFFYIKSFI